MNVVAVYLQIIEGHEETLYMSAIFTLCCITSASLKRFALTTVISMSFCARPRAKLQSSGADLGVTSHPPGAAAYFMLCSCTYLLPLSCHFYIFYL